MDQQRDYDQTLSKMEFNKTTQLQWTLPQQGSASPSSKAPSLVMSPPAYSKSSSNDSHDNNNQSRNLSQKKPQPPTKKLPFEQGNTNSSIPPTHQAIIVNSVKDGDNSSPNFIGRLNSISSDKLDLASISSGSSFSYSVNNSIRNPPAPNNATSSSSNRPIMRPIRKPPDPSPHRLHSRDITNSDSYEDDLEMGDFTSDSNHSQSPSKRPDNIPLLPISSSAGPHAPPIHLLKPTPSLTSKPPLIQGGGGGGGVGGGFPSSSSSSEPPPQHHSFGDSKFSPPGVRPSTTAHLPIIMSSPPMGLVAPGARASTASGPGGPSSSANAESNLPVVKETKDVRRNRAQIPDTLRHAKPNTGNWLNNRYIVNNYILLDVLGTGSYGEVRLCKDRITEKLYAIKIISKDFLKKKKNNKSNETYFEDIKREIAIMKKLLHPNILMLFEVLDDPNVNKMYLVLEYMKMGDLVNILKRRTAEESGGNNNNSAANGFTPLSDYEVWSIFRQLASGIKYLHLQNVVHGDIKPQNLLLGEDGVLKVADFGISHMLSASGQKLADAAGTPAFMSPELCEGKLFSGQSADIWAMGATIFMLRFGHPPFIAKNIINLYSKIVNDPLVFPLDIDPGLRNILENLLEKDPQKRFTMPQIINHPWLRHMPLNPNPMGGRMSFSTARGASGSTHTGGTLPTVSMTSESSSGGKVVDNKEGRPLKDSGKTTSMMSMLTFIPPPTYDAEEAAATSKVIKELDNNDLFMSIGGIRKSPRFVGGKTVDSVFEHVKRIIS